MPVPLNAPDAPGTMVTEDEPPSQKVQVILVIVLSTSEPLKLKGHAGAVPPPTQLELPTTVEIVGLAHTRKVTED